MSELSGINASIALPGIDCGLTEARLRAAAQRELAEARTDPCIGSRAREHAERLRAARAGGATAATLEATFQRYGEELLEAAAADFRELAAIFRHQPQLDAPGGELDSTLSALGAVFAQLDPAAPAGGAAARGLRRLSALVPWLRSSPGRYFRRFESASTELDAITRTLRAAQDRCKLERLALGEHRQRLQRLARRLQNARALLDGLGPAREAGDDTLMASAAARAEALDLHLEALLRLQVASEWLDQYHAAMHSGLAAVVGATLAALQAAVSAASSRDAGSLSSPAAGWQTLREAFAALRRQLGELQRFRSSVVPQRLSTLAAQDEALERAAAARRAASPPSAEPLFHIHL